MSHQGETEQLDSAAASDEYEKLRRLVEIQRQIVELAKHNELAEKQCEGMRRKLARRLGWRARLASLLRRKRNGSPFQTPPGSAMDNPFRLPNGRLQRAGQETVPGNSTPPSPVARP